MIYAIAERTDYAVGLSGINNTAYIFESRPPDPYDERPHYALISSGARDRSIHRFLLDDLYAIKLFQTAEAAAKFISSLSDKNGGFVLHSLDTTVPMLEVVKIVTSMVFDSKTNKFGGDR